MNTLDSLKLMVDHYPGGRAAVAQRIGKTEEVLRKELSGAPTHKMGVIDACAISSMCMEVRSENCNMFATSVAGASGGFIALEVREMAGKQDLRADMVGLLKECTDVIQKLTEALADESISDNERKSIERELLDVTEKVQDILKGTRSRHAASQPVALRSAA